MNTLKPSDIVLFDNGETLEDLFIAGSDVFTVEQMTAILNVFIASRNPETIQLPTAKIYNMADYRR